MTWHVDVLEDPDGAPYPEAVQVMWDHICDLAVVRTTEPTRETVVAALESVRDNPDDSDSDTSSRNTPQ